MTNEQIACRVEGGKIVEQWGLSGYLTCYMQLGLIDLPGMPARKL